MAYSQSELGARFRNGATTGTASNVEIRELENGGTVLVGYGHAVYAYRSPSGHITSYLGWANSDNTRPHSGSASTVQQFGQLKIRSRKHVDEKVTGESIDAAPKARSFSPPQLA